MLFQQHSVALEVEIFYRSLSFGIHSLESMFSLQAYSKNVFPFPLPNTTCYVQEV